LQKPVDTKPRFFPACQDIGCTGGNENTRLAPSEAPLSKEFGWKDGDSADLG